MFGNSSLNMNDDELYFMRKAEIVKWYQSVLCSCGNTPDMANNNCLACGGLGRIYPNPPIYLHAQLSQIKLDLALPEIGIALSGDMMLSESPKERHNFAQYDIIQPTWENGIPFEGQVVTRGTGATDTLWYRCAQIDLVTVTNPVTGVVTQYTPGVDVTCDGSRQLTWGANAPTGGALYSIKYRAIFEWGVMVPGIPRFERGTDLGQKVILRKRHILLPNLPDILQD